MARTAALLIARTVPNRPDCPILDPFWDKFCVCVETVCAMSNDTPLTTMPNTGNGTVLPRPVLQAQHRPREYPTFWVGRIAT